MKGHTKWVNSVCFSSDDKLALSGSGDNTIKLWNIETGECVYTFIGHMKTVLSVHFSEIDRYALSGSEDKTIRMWNIKTGDCIRIINEYGLFGNSMCFSSEEKFALSGGDSNMMKLWNVKTGECIRSFGEYENFKTSMCFSLDNEFALSGGKDGRVRLWSISYDPKYEMIVSQIQSSESTIKELEKFDFIASEIKRLISQKEIKKALNQIKKIRKIESFASSEKYFNLYRRIVPYCTSKNINSYALQEISNITDKIEDVYWMDEKIFALSKLKDKTTIKIWDITTGQLHYIIGKNIHFWSLCFSPDGKFVLSECAMGELKIWNVKTSECISTLAGNQSISSMCFSPNSRQVLLGSNFGTMELWDIAKNICLVTMDPGVCSSVCFSPDGKFILSGGVEQITKTAITKLWDIKTGKCIYTWDEGDLGSSYFFELVCFSPDGKLALSLNKNNTMKIRNIRTNQCTNTLIGHTDIIDSFCFSPDGKSILSGSKDETVKLWDVKTGICIYTFKGIPTMIDKLRFSPDGRKILVIARHEIQIFTIDYDLYFPGWHDWDEGARPYLDIFLTLHPKWTDEDFNNFLIPDLQNRGYGWLRPEGVMAKLKEITKTHKILDSL